MPSIVQKHSYIFSSSTQTCRNIEKESHLPPWCLTASLTGHTFPDANTAAFIPSVSFVSGSPKMALPATLVNVPSFSTIVIANESESPTSYSLEAGNSDAEKKLFVIKPDKGVIAPREKKILALMFTPDRQSEIQFPSGLSLKLFFLGYF